MTELRIIKDTDSVSICKGCDDSSDAFIDIYTDDESTPSVFRTIDDAILFAEVIVKLLEVVT